MTLEPSSPLPLYHQLERVLAERIADGRYRDGFPGDLDLAAEFSVSRGTVRQALERLARSGLIVRHQGRGSFVAAPLEYPLGRFYRFAHEMQVRGIPESSQVLARGVVRAPAAVAAALGLARGDRLLRIVRLRLAGDRPLLLETSHLPDDVGAPLRFADLSAGSMYDLLEEGGVRLSRVTEEVHPVSLRAEEAEPFGLPPGAPAFAVERLALAGERPVEHRLVLAPGDRVTLTASWGSLA
jgi:GntR family transcriptional regulator